jgi:hypothetical protein
LCAQNPQWLFGSLPNAETAMIKLKYRTFLKKNRFFPDFFCGLGKSRAIQYLEGDINAFTPIETSFAKKVTQPHSF